MDIYGCLSYETKSSLYFIIIFIYLVLQILIYNEHKLQILECVSLALFR